MRYDMPGMRHIARPGTGAFSSISPGCRTYLFKSGLKYEAAQSDRTGPPDRHGRRAPGPWREPVTRSRLPWVVEPLPGQEGVQRLDDRRGERDEGRRLRIHRLGVGALGQVLYELPPRWHLRTASERTVWRDGVEGGRRRGIGRGVVARKWRGGVRSPWRLEVARVEAAPAPSWCQRRRRARGRGTA